MELSFFNVKDGYLEALVRGLRSGFLSADEYRRLAQCESIDDMKLALEETDYGMFLQDEPSPIPSTVIGQKCREKLANEFRHLRSQANYPLSKFLDFLTVEKMIDNVVGLIQGTVNKKSPQDLLGRVDPLGWFPEMKAIASMDITSGYEEIYKTLLIDTPVGPYFESFLKQVTPADSESRSMQEVASIFNETDLELMKNMLKKAWLEDFNAFCETLGGSTAEVMGHILKTNSDFRVMSVTLNSLNTMLGSSQQLGDRNLLYPSLGYLYPEGTDRIRKAWNETTVRAALEPYKPYAALFDLCAPYYSKERSGVTDIKQLKSLEDLIYEKEVELCEFAFEQQFHYGVFYSWVKLREQEIRNIVWIADMISMGRKEHTEEIVPIFRPRY
ncbi:unnamed protein product [Vitrella brassicaformis CCMP3155]|uniref:V-type proton ATPase subunit n=1 Tax=Vitrella brassicaformis (strain CCMP3155) TaxID=1169540 RepID=A0A0G4FL34_VITBC|nr:unnamed protein product [Vitrella brassicaformis CCMP3155]|eukprot:CEM14541.1 unnamed protein product [Vitrella brassicaformis CCMP3155]